MIKKEGLPLLCLFICILCLPGCDLFPGGDIDTSKGMDALGRGYDVFSVYADPEYIKAPILDIDAVQSNDYYETNEIEKGEFTSSSGTTFSEYSSKLNVKTKMEGSYSYYSGSIEANFSTERFESTEYNFATVHSDIKKYALNIKNRTNPDLMKEYILPSVIEEINNLETKEDCFDFFETYGTHVLTGIILGARLDFSLSAKNISTSGSTSIETYAKAEYKSMFSSASLEVGVDSDHEWSEEFSNTEKRTMVIGGKSEYGQNIQNDGDYQDWINSIDENPVFSNVNSNGVMPIWELIDDEDKAALLEANFTEWAAEKSLDISPTSTCVIDLYATSGDKGNTYDRNGYKYHKVDQDLNEGAGGDYIYLYVCYGNSDGSSGRAPISHIAVAYDFDQTDAFSDIPSDWTRVHHDLNSNVGSHSDYIYLCYYRDENYEYTPVTNVYVLNDSDNDKAYPYDHDTQAYKDLGYSRIKRMLDGNTNNSDTTDLNRNAGTGSDFIYLYYTTQSVD